MCCISVFKDRRKLPRMKCVMMGFCFGINATNRLEKRYWKHQKDVTLIECKHPNSLTYLTGLGSANRIGVENW